ncbi:MAG: hypothetical protein A2W31_14380 [Planctomycetes bacterium RBG_16_64_10]|nr:MAG: hypothetical protein A2W31_14380 [Planctomycetes bacterium RBG_16_64_10]
MPFKCTRLGVGAKNRASEGSVAPAGAKVVALHETMAYLTPLACGCAVDRRPIARATAMGFDLRAAGPVQGAPDSRQVVGGHLHRPGKEELHESQEHSIMGGLMHTGLWAGDAVVGLPTKCAAASLI